ncbi:hypothetical protein G6F60_014832 [Rhizopus arrhizus]|nr:hypothetical protein G6F60_014832 [Rhizopus arrhizus]
MVALEQGGLTDLGGIPLSFVERIELVRGGASAIYGADAMSGVVNIILKDHFEGVDVNVRAGGTQQGGGDNQRVQVVGGGSGDPRAPARLHGFAGR